MDEQPLRNERMEELIGQLSPEARELWEETERMARMPDIPQGRRLVEIMEILSSLPTDDQENWVELIEERERALAVRVAEVQGRANLSRQISGLIRRAIKLDPLIGENPTVGEAVEVLKRHGEKLGVSDEVLEMHWDVPGRGLYPDFDEPGRWKRQDGSHDDEVWTYLLKARESALRQTADKIREYRPGADVAWIMRALWELDEEDAQEYADED